MRYYLYCLFILFLFSCAKKATVNPEDILYIYDQRTNTCFAIAGDDDDEESTLGFAQTECKKVLHLLNLEEGQIPEIEEESAARSGKNCSGSLNDFTTKQKLKSIPKVELDQFCKGEFERIIKGLLPVQYIDLVKKYLPKGMTFTDIRRKAIKVYR